MNNEEKPRDWHRRREIEGSDQQRHLTKYLSETKAATKRWRWPDEGQMADDRRVVEDHKQGKNPTKDEEDKVAANKLWRTDYKQSNSPRKDEKVVGKDLMKSPLKLNNQKFERERELGGKPHTGAEGNDTEHSHYRWALFQWVQCKSGVVAQLRRGRSPIKRQLEETS
eukprot:Gb_28185 [translate_table: standard]